MDDFLHPHATPPAPAAGPRLGRDNGLVPYRPPPQPHAVAEFRRDAHIWVDSVTSTTYGVLGEHPLVLTAIIVALALVAWRLTRALWDAIRD